MAFLGYPEGHRVKAEAECRGTNLLFSWILSSEPERRKNRLANIGHETLWGPGLPHTLKLPAVLDISRRNALLSSKLSN
jgi:hypothetical protein